MNALMKSFLVILSFSVLVCCAYQPRHDAAPACQDSAFISEKRAVDPKMLVEWADQFARSSQLARRGGLTIEPSFLFSTESLFEVFIPSDEEMLLCMRLLSFGFERGLLNIEDFMRCTDISSNGQELAWLAYRYSFRRPTPDSLALLREMVDQQCSGFMRNTALEMMAIDGGLDEYIFLREKAAEAPPWSKRELLLVKDRIRQRRNIVSGGTKISPGAEDGN